MKFRTEYNSSPVPSLLNPEESVVLIGSCFTDYIGGRMRRGRWKAFPNITGTLFNPSSIARLLKLAISLEGSQEEINDSIAERDGRWISWLADSKSSSFNMEDTIHILEQRILFLHNKLKEAHALIITFGTSWIYELRNRPGYVVSNCHKFTAETFIRRRLSVEEIVEEWDYLLTLLYEKYPDLRIIFTVSPVRHLKDGFEGNCRSKAILQLACEELCNENPQADYFPSYEIMMDDLRDYRFYSSDMVHPSEDAVEYIWEKFQDRYLSGPSKALLKEGEKVTKRLLHRPNMQEISKEAKSEASIFSNEAKRYYLDFISTHPGMLRIDE